MNGALCPICNQYSIKTTPTSGVLRCANPDCGCTVIVGKQEVKVHVEGKRDGGR